MGYFDKLFHDLLGVNNRQAPTTVRRSGRGDFMPDIEGYQRGSSAPSAAPDSLGLVKGKVGKYFDDLLGVNKTSDSNPIDDLRDLLTSDDNPRDKYGAIGLQDGPSVKPVQGTYDTLADSRDREVFKRAGDDIRHTRLLFVPVSNAGRVSGFPIQCDANGLLILSRTLGSPGGVEVESSDSARIYVQINDGDWIPFSFNILPQGSNKGDANFFGGRIVKLDIFVQVPTQDTLGQPFIILALLKAATLTGAFGQAQLYGAPTNPGGSSGGGTTSASSSTPPPAGGGGGGGGGAPPPPAGGGGGGGTGGQGGTGGGGTHQNL